MGPTILLNKAQISPCKSTAKKAVSSHEIESASRKWLFFVRAPQATFWQDKAKLNSDRSAFRRASALLCNQASPNRKQGMSSTNIEERKEPEQGGADGDIVSLSRSQNDNDPTVEMEAEIRKIKDQNGENSFFSTQHEEENMKEKYGGLVPKMKPLISKDHERAFFDSADWALGKQGAQKPKGPLEGLRPKLEVTPHHQVRSRLSADASTNECEGSQDINHSSAETEECMLDGGQDEAGDHTGRG